MNTLISLLELQGIHDNLRTIERDLTDFPPDMAKSNSDMRSLAKRIAESEKALQETKARASELTTSINSALKLEEHSRKSLKSATSKVQYTAAIRELDERERQVASIRKPLQEATSKLVALENELSELTRRHAEAKEQFDSLHAIFLSEHENQVVAKDLLVAKKLELEAVIQPKHLTHFNKLLNARQGKAMAAVESSACTGCRTKVRIPLMSELRESGMVLCESCQRFLYIQPSR